MRAHGTLQVHRQRLARRPTVLVQAIYGPHPVSVQLTVRKHLSYGLHLYLVGSFTSPPWDKKNGVELKWSEGHTWTTTVMLPSESKVEYKYVTRTKAGDLQEWQSGPNNVLVPPKEADAIEVVDNWDDSQRSKVNITKPHQRPSPSAVAKPKFDPVEKLIAAALSSVDQAGSPPPSRSPSPSQPTTFSFPRQSQQSQQQQPAPQSQSSYASSPSPPPRYSNGTSYGSNGSSYGSNGSSPFGTAPSSNGHSNSYSSTSGASSTTNGASSTTTSPSSSQQQPTAPPPTSSPSPAPAPQQEPTPAPQPAAYIPGTSPARMTASELLATLQAQTAADSPPAGIMGAPIDNGSGATTSTNSSSTATSSSTSRTSTTTSTPSSSTSSSANAGTKVPKGIGSNGHSGASSTASTTTSSTTTASAPVSSKGIGSTGNTPPSAAPSSPAPSSPSPPSLSSSTYSAASPSSKSPSPGTAKRAEQLVQQQQELARAFEEMKSDRSNPAAPALQAVSSQLSAGLEVLGTGSSHSSSDNTSASSDNGDAADKATSSGANKASSPSKSSNGANFQAIKERVLHASNGSNGHAPRASIPGLAGASSNIVSTGGVDSIRGKTSSSLNNQPLGSNGTRPLGPGASTHQSLGGPTDLVTSILHSSRGGQTSGVDQEAAGQLAGSESTALDSAGRAVRSPRMNRVVVKHGQLRTQLGSMSVGELRYELRRRNMPVGGPRPELIARLVEAGVRDP